MVYVSARAGQKARVFKWPETLTQKTPRANAILTLAFVVY